MSKTRTKAETIALLDTLIEDLEKIERLQDAMETRMDEYLESQK